MVTKKKLTWKDISLSYEQAVEIAWQRGLLTYKLLKHQKDLFKIIAKKGKRKTLINCTRRFGKTTCLLIYCFIFCIQNPLAEVKFVAPTQKALRKSIFPIIRKILADCPKAFRPKWSTQDGCYRFPNGCELHIYGTDQQQHDSLRGQSCELGIVDEASYCSDLHYVVQDILLPQTLTCDGRLILASTPNKKATQSGEEYKEFCVEAEMNNAYYTKTIYDNTSLKKSIIKEYMKESGGETSITWKVEYLCMFVIDEEKALVPEWNSDYVMDVPHPDLYPHYHKYTSLDLGVKRDFTVILVAYYDFSQACLVVLDEWAGKNMVSLDIVNAMKEKEAKYFTNGIVYRRVADSDNPLLLNDLCSLHNLPIIPTSKTVLESMVNNLRSWINDGRIVVHPRCKMLIQTLEQGVWADTVLGNQRKDFGRTKSLGHMDCIASLMYLVRNVDVSSNPIPPNLGVDMFNNQEVYQRNNRNTGPHKELKDLFTKKVFK